MSDEVRADVLAMEKFAATSRDRGEQLLNQGTWMNVVRLAPGDFGYIPGIGPRVYKAYGEYVDGIANSIGSAADAMFALSDAVKDAALAYQETDGEVAESFNGLHVDPANLETDGGR